MIVAADCTNRVLHDTAPGTSIAKVQKLPESDQDAIATMILAEIADEQQWEAAFADSQDQFARVAQKVRDDIRAGRSQRFAEEF